MQNHQPQLKAKPIVLIILDGWGYREEKEANAIAHANKPFWDEMWDKYPHTTILGSGTCVGLPDGQMGNSEVGHLNMGAGRVVHQDLTRIESAIANDEFCANPTLTKILNQTKQNAGALHLLGLLSPGGVHSHEKHFFAMLECARRAGLKKVYIHPFLDGRDTPPQSAKSSLERLQAHCDKLHCGEIVSLIGRYYAMDRDKRWDRIHAAYKLLVEGEAPYHADTPLQGLAAAYQRGETDEFVKPTAIYKNTKPITLNDGDSVIFMNFRADRARELTTSITSPDFIEFKRDKIPQLAVFATLTQYDKKYALPCLFSPESLKNILGEYVSALGLQQLRIAETEKYAHVTFFFNGGVEAPFPGEDRLLVPSQKVATYDLKPEMSAFEVTDQLVDKINSGQYDLIVCNYANPDMVGHSGNFPATVKAIEVIDECLKKVITAVLAAGGEALITADHGNAEQLYDYQHNQPHTAHTTEPVPLIYVGSKFNSIQNDGILSDIAPTLLTLMGLPIPPEMTGRNLMGFRSN